MGTHRSIKNRINRCFEVAATTHLDCSRGMNRWVKCSEMERNRLHSGMNVIRFDQVKDEVVIK